MPRNTCYVMREFGVIKAKRTIYEPFKAIGQAFDKQIGLESDLIVLLQGCMFGEEEVLAAYNAAGYPPIETCITLPRADFEFVQRRGYPEFMARKIKGLIR